MSRLTRLLLTGALALVSALQAQPGDFSLTAITARLITTLHSIADQQNQDAIAGYTIAVANAKQNAEATGNPPAFVNPPLLRRINDDQVRLAESDWRNYSKYQISDFYAYVPPPPTATPKPVTPSNLVGPDVGNGFFACVANDPSPDSTKYADGRGLFVKHLYVTPFGKGCGWTLLAGAPPQ